LDQGLKVDSSIRTSFASADDISVGAAVGSKSGQLGRAFVKLLTTPRIGHEALTVILEPNLAVKPSSIMLPLKQITSMRQASFFYGPVQSGIAKAFSRLLQEGKIPQDSIENEVAILAVDINLQTRNRRDVTSRTEKIASNALRELWR
jgi:5,6,7,8-tetrahydromethanopterin hydro-lyase